MRKVRLGAALLAVVLLLQFVARSSFGPRAKINVENDIETQRNDIDKRAAERALPAPPPRSSELAGALRAITSPSRNRVDEVPAPDVKGAGEAGERSLPSVYDPDWARGKFAHFTPEESAAMADRCELRWQLPPLTTSGPSAFGADYDRALGDAQKKHREALAALYRESGNDDAGLSLRALDDALRMLSPEDGIAVHRRLAGERAGDPPTTDGSIYERYLRLSLAAGDDFESSLAGSVGAAQAQSWRQAAGPKMTLTGCDPQHSIFRSSR
jgi:hypothetical protein